MLIIKCLIKKNIAFRLCWLVFLVLKIILMLCLIEERRKEIENKLYESHVSFTIIPPIIYLL